MVYLTLFIYVKKGVVSSKICHRHLPYWWITAVVSNSASLKHLPSLWISVVAGGQEGWKTVTHDGVWNWPVAPPWSNGDRSMNMDVNEI